MAVDSRRQPSQAVAAVRQLHAVVRDARQRLTSPTIENLDYCRCRMDEAADAFRQLQDTITASGRKQDAALSASLTELRAEIARVGILLDSAAAFHAGWIQRAGSMVSGYTDKGTPAAPEGRGRLILEI
ncbi:MAG: hypothetical protein HYX25_00900 [Candidatus Solibacter usitatus]|nr:hypothetical protein [Candidatus Solibacter usitatus]